MSFEVAFERLRTHPLAGRSADSVSSGLRRLVHRSHRIFYRVNDDRVVIVRVLHHSQDERRLLR